ncbi:uncharacterized protein [Paramisgurnus dabryanus]|uniref:uncharacterized protein isoform X2 n=1 Tax=Paramisgurnus dabryanus TaxID=90735 RepID=UPI003CCFA2C6
MRGYTWTSNQRPSPICQEPPPPYHASRNFQHNARQSHFDSPPYPTGQARHHSGHQEVVNNWNFPTSNTDGFAQGFQRNFGWYEGQQNQTFSQQPFTGQHQHFRSSNFVGRNTDGFVSDNPNADNYHARYNMQACSNAYFPTQQNYRQTGPPNINVAHMYCAQYSDHGNSRTMSNDNRDWSSNISDNCRSYQQPQRRQAHFYPQQSGQQQTPRRPSTPKHWAKDNAVTKKHNKSQAGLKINTSPPSKNFKQSRTELRSNATLNVPAAPSPKNQSSPEHSTPDTKGKSCDVNQNFHIHQTSTYDTQFNPTSRHDFNLTSYINSQLYRLLCSNEGTQDNKSATNKQPSDVGVENTSMEKSEDGDASVTDDSSQSRQLSSEPNLQSVVEPPSKRKKYELTQTNYWNKFPSKNSSVSKDGRLQSALPGTCQIGTTEENSSGQSEIQYVSDPTQCLEAVFALTKAFQQKAIAVVPPISQQTSNTEKMDDACKRVVDSPPLKIDAVWSLSEECDESKDPVINADDKLSQDSSPEVQQDGRISPVSKTTNNIADPSVTQSLETDVCQNDVQQSDTDSSETEIELSNVPVVEYTLEKLKRLVQSMEMTESFAERTEKPEGSVFDQILDKYWNGDVCCLLKYIRTNILDDVRHSLYVQNVEDDKSVVFKSITPENVKEVARFIVVNNETCSSPQEFRSSWLNVDAQPDIEKVLSEPLSNYITISELAPYNICVHADNLGEKDLEVTSFDADEQSERPDTGSFAEIVTPSAGNGRVEMTKEDKGHSNAKICGVAFPRNVPSEQETFEKRGDKMQNRKHLHTKPLANISPIADMYLERRHDSTKETLSQEHIRDKQEQVLASAPLLEQQVKLGSEQPHNNLLPVCPGDKPLPFVNAVSDCVKTTEDQSNFINTWQVEDISDDDSSGKMEVLTNSTDAMQVENFSKDENLCNTEALANSKDTMQTESIAEDENLGNMEVITNSTDKWQVEDISDDDNSGNIEAIADSTDAMQVENVYENENSGKIEVLSNLSDAMQVEEISDDENSDNENSFNDCLLMDMTVLSSEDALKFFQQLENQPQCDVKNSELVALSSNEPNCEYIQPKTCSRCGTNTIVTSEFTVDVNKMDSELFCIPCWETAPSPDLAIKPCSPEKSKIDVVGSDTKELEQNCSLPCLKSEVFETVIASTVPHKAHQRAACDKVVNSVPDKASEVQIRDFPTKSYAVENSTPNKAPETPSGGFPTENANKATKIQRRVFPKEKPKSEAVESSTPKKAPETPSRAFPPEKPKSDAVESSTPKKAPETPSRAFPPEKPKSDAVERSTPNKAPDTPSRGFPTEKPKSDAVERSTPNKAPESPSRCFLTEKPKSDAVESSTPKKAPETPSRGFPPEKPKSDAVERSTPNKDPETPSRCFLTEKPKKAPETSSRGFPTENANKATKIQSRDFMKEKPKTDAVESSTPNKAPEIQLRDFPTENENSEKMSILRSQLLIQRKKHLPLKSAFRSSAGDGSDDTALFAPDIVLKKRRPKKQNHSSSHATAVSATNLPVGKSQDCNSVINQKETRQKRQDPPLQVVNDKTMQDHKEKVREKGSCYLKPYLTTKLDRANKTPVKHSENLSPKKTVKKKVRFALFGTKSDHQCAAQERRFSPPATLTVFSAFQDSSKQWSQNKHPCFPQGRRFSDPSTSTVSSASKDYSDVLSAKQKVHNQWSSTFIPKVKKTSPPRSPPRSPQKVEPQKVEPQKVEPQKKKPQKPQEVLKSNMVALKKQILYRAMLSSQETEQKHTKH